MADLFKFLSKLGSGNSNLTEEELTEFSPVVIARWMTGTSNPLQIIKLNETVNPYLFSKVPPAKLFKLIASSCEGGRVSWLKGPSSHKDKLVIKAIANGTGKSSREAKMLVDQLDDDVILGLANELGWDKETVKKLQLELNGRKRT